MCPSDLAKKTKLIIPNKEMDDIMKIVKSLGESVLLIKSVSETIKSKKKSNQKVDFRSMLLLMLLKLRYLASVI